MQQCQKGTSCIQPINLGGKGELFPFISFLFSKKSLWNCTSSLSGGEHHCHQIHPLPLPPLFLPTQFHSSSLPLCKLLCPHCYLTWSSRHGGVQWWSCSNYVLQLSAQNGHLQSPGCSFGSHFTTAEVPSADKTFCTQQVFPCPWLWKGNQRASFFNSQPNFTLNTQP